MTSKAKTDPGHREGLILVGLLSLILIVAIDWVVSINHQLVVQEQGINEKWAQVLNIYQRRADLVPALVEQVKSVAIQEQAVAEDVTTARSRALGIRTTREVINDRTALQSFRQAQQELGGALSRLQVTAAHYPDLMSNQSLTSKPPPARTRPRQSFHGALSRTGLRCRADTGLVDIDTVRTRARLPALRQDRPT